MNGLLSRAGSLPRVGLLANVGMLAYHGLLFLFGTLQWCGFLAPTLARYALMVYLLRLARSEFLGYSDAVARIRLWVY